MAAEKPSRDTFENTWATPSGDEGASQQTLSLPSSESNADQGPCLYLGPSGQRCSRRALAGGYCANHRPGGLSLPKVALTKRTLAAIAAASWFLWPYLGEVLREIVRWIHSH